MKALENHSFDMTIAIASRWGGSTYYYTREDLFALGKMLEKIPEVSEPFTGDDDDPDFFAINLIRRFIELKNTAWEDTPA